MTQENPSLRFPSIPDISERDAGDLFHREELQLALRNRGMPLEAMRYPVTPSGMHYLVIHFDIPDVDVDHWKLQVGGLVSNPFSLSLGDTKARPAREWVGPECDRSVYGKLEPPQFVPAFLGARQWPSFRRLVLIPHQSGNTCGGSIGFPIYEHLEF